MDGLQRAVVSLYGPEAGNQTSSFRLSSYPLDATAKYSAGESPPYLPEDLTSAAWVVFSIADNSQGQARLISTFLAEQQDLLRDKRVILFTFGAPTYLDATDISRLTAYYALYSKQQPFIEVAARLLFQEITPVGASPVSVAGLGYDLRSVTSPDPDQIISLALDLPGGGRAAGRGYAGGHSGAVVPDRRHDRNSNRHDHVITTDTRCRMERWSPSPWSCKAKVAASCSNRTRSPRRGSPEVSFGLEKPGLLEIRATSDPARVSQVLQLDVGSSGQAAAVTVIVPQLTESAEAPRWPNTGSG